MLPPARIIGGAAALVKKERGCLSCRVERSNIPAGIVQDNCTAFTFLL